MYLFKKIIDSNLKKKIKRGLLLNKLEGLKIKGFDKTGAKDTFFKETQTFLPRRSKHS